MQAPKFGGIPNKFGAGTCLSENYKISEFQACDNFVLLFLPDIHSERYFPDPHVQLDSPLSTLDKCYSILSYGSSN